MKNLAALISSIPLASAFGFSNGKHLLTELKKYGFEAERVADYGCYCQFLTDGGVNPPDGQPMDEFDLVCFQYTQCLRCLDIDQCTHGVYKGYNEKNEFCKASEYGCENNLCKCQKKLIQDMMNLSWSGVQLTRSLSAKGGFERSENCQISDKPDQGNQCCGDYPSRYPFSSQYDRSCCGGRTYNPLYYECCPGNTVKLSGTC
jgi:hypothetical protein